MGSELCIRDRVVALLHAYRPPREMKRAGIAELNEGGRQLARALADEIATGIDQIKRSLSADWADSADSEAEKSAESAQSADDSSSAEADNA